MHFATVACGTGLAIPLLVPPLRRTALFFLACLTAAACYDGRDGGAGDDATDGGNPSGADSESGQPDATSADSSGGDDPGDGVGVDDFGPSHLRRLTDWEYANTVRDLFGDAVADSVAGSLAVLPASHVEEGYSTMDTALTSAHVDAYYAAALAIAQRVSTDDTVLAEIEPCLPAGDAACIDAFANTFARRVFRRPPTDLERERMAAAYATPGASDDRDRTESLLLYMLMAPPFLYRPEIDGSPSATDEVISLTDYELASRLSYFLWGSMPDATLLQAADDGALDAEGVVEQAERMLDHPKARAGVARFFAEWMQLQGRPGLAFSGRFIDGLPLEGLRDDMMAEPLRLAEALVFDDAGTFSDLWTSSQGTVSSPGLAAIYGVAPDGNAPVDLPLERRGMLTRAAFLLGSGDESPPIVRGAFVSNRLLCNALHLPPADALPGAGTPPAFDPTKTNRERWEEKTSPAACRSCHEYINPYGFAAEGYDALGRTRTHEEIVDPDGQIVGTLPVDTEVTLALDGETHQVADLVALQAVFASSPAVARCFAQQWWSFGFGREVASEDTTAIDALAGEVLDAPLRDLVVQVVASPQFRFTKFAP